MSAEKLTLHLDHPPESVPASVMTVKDGRRKKQLLRGARTKLGLAPEILWI